MGRSLLALILTTIAGLIGMFIGAAAHLEGYLGIIMAIAVMGSFIVLSIEDGNAKDEPDAKDANTEKN